MSVQLVAVRFDARDPAVVGAFWAGLLGRDVIEEADGVLVPGDPSQVGLRFVESTAEKPERNRLHLHVTSETSDDQQRAVDTVSRLGGGRRGRGTKPLPIGRDIYMADPDGNEFCVIAPGDDYLAGCGLLGEVTCDGTRATGRFWLEALEWSLVWDQGEQIAIQSPEGGTKIAWDSWPEAATTDWNRRRFDLVASDVAAEVRRLVALGATRLEEREDVVKLVDPDGSEFSLSTRLA